MKLLIIGGNGYIGSSLYQECINSHIDVTSVDLCLFGDNLTNSIVQDYNHHDISSYSHIVLLAAHSSVALAEHYPYDAWNNNVTSFFNLCMRLDKSQVLIYASSASVYGNSKEISTERSLNINPINHYDLTKITDDVIANKFIAEGKQIVGLRFGTLNGASPTIRSDLMINSMYYNVVSGKPINVKNTHLFRPILGISDCINCIIKILNTDIVSGQFNLASFNTTVDTISLTVCKILNAKIVYFEDDPVDKQYNFSISTEKFSSLYDYIFTETLESITNSLIDSSIDVFFPRNFLG